MKSLLEWEEERKAMFDLHSCNKTLQMMEEFELEKKHFVKHNSNRESSLTFFDLSAAKFLLYICPTKRWILQKTVNLDDPFNLENLKEITHKDDRIFSIETELMGYNILMSLPLDERKKFWFRFSQRLKNINGLYCFYVVTIKVYSFDAEANPYILVIETKCLPDTYKPEKLHFREFSHSLNKKKKQSECIIKKLTKLEIELLHLIHKGFTTKEIADYRNKSYHTIKNERKGILRKLDVKNTIIAYDVANKLDLL